VGLQPAAEREPAPRQVWTPRDDFPAIERERLAQAPGEEVSAPLPLASLARDHDLPALAWGWAGRDWAALAEVSAVKAGLRPLPGG
jgi:hypothetical protein